MVTEIWVNIGSGNGLLSFTGPMLTDHELSPMTFILICVKICVKITCLKFHSNFLRANELSLGGTRLIYSQVPLQRALIHHYMTYFTALSVSKSGSDIRITTDTL